MPRSKTDLKSHADSALSKLFGVEAGEVATGTLKLVSPAQIETKTQPRTSFPKGDIAELAASIDALRAQNVGIEKTGILQALLVAPLSDKGSGQARYRLVAGERRLRAARQLDLPHVPVVVQSDSDDESLTWAMQMIENLQRRDLAPLEEARALRHLLDERQMSIRGAAALIGKPKSYLSDRLALLDMGADVQQLVSDRSDTLLHARIIDRVTEAPLRQELIKATRAGASRRDIENRIAQNTVNADQEETNNEGQDKDEGSDLNGYVQSVSGKDIVDQDTNRSSDRSDTATPKKPVSPAPPGSSLTTKNVLQELLDSLHHVTAPLKNQNIVFNKKEGHQITTLLDSIDSQLTLLRQAANFSK